VALVGLLVAEDHHRGHARLLTRTMFIGWC